MAHFHLWINVWVARKTVSSDPSLTRAIPERFIGEYRTHYKALCPVCCQVNRMNALHHALCVLFIRYIVFLSFKRQ